MFNLKVVFTLIFSHGGKSNDWEVIYVFISKDLIKEKKEKILFMKKVISTRLQLYSNFIFCFLI